MLPRTAGGEGRIGLDVTLWDMRRFLSCVNFLAHDEDMIWTAYVCWFVNPIRKGDVILLLGSPSGSTERVASLTPELEAKRCCGSPAASGSQSIFFPDQFRHC